MKSLVLLLVSIMGAAQISHAGWGFGDETDPDVITPVIYKDQYKVKGIFQVEGVNQFTISESSDRSLILQDGDLGQVEISKGNIFSGNRYIKIDSNGKTVRFKLPKKQVDGRNFISYSDESKTISTDVQLSQSQPRTIERWDTCSYHCGYTRSCYGSSTDGTETCSDQPQYCSGREFNRHTVVDQTEVFTFEVKTKKNAVLTLITEPRIAEVIKTTAKLRSCR